MDVCLPIYLSIPCYCFVSIHPRRKKTPLTHSRVYYKYPASEVDLIDTLAVLSHQSFIEMNITSLFCFVFTVGSLFPTSCRGFLDSIHLSPTVQSLQGTYS